MFEDLKYGLLDPYYVDGNGVPHFAEKRIEDDPYGYIELCLKFACEEHYIDKLDYLYLLSKYKMLYDNWFHGDN